MIINKPNMAVLNNGFRAAFNAGFRDAPVYWPKVATEIPSGTLVENYSWLGQFPDIEEWIGERVEKDMEQYGYSIKNKEYAGGVSVPRPSIEDDQYGVYKPLMAEMGFAVKTFPDLLVFQLLAAGWANLCYDGQAFFSDSHPMPNGTFVSNDDGGASNPWVLMDAKRPLKPMIFQNRRPFEFVAKTKPDDEGVYVQNKFRYGTDGRCNVGFGFWQQAHGSKQDLTDDAFNSAYAALLGRKSDQGRPLNLTPSLLVCGPSNRAAAYNVVKAERKASGASNINFQVVDVLVVPWLT